jgi:hypothetical protein
VGGVISGRPTGIRDLYGRLKTSVFIAFYPRLPGPSYW